MSIENVVKIERFVSSYNREFGFAYTEPEWLDKPDAADERVEVIYRSGEGLLAIEHTLVQPFPGEKHERALLDGFLPAEGAPSFPRFYISVGIPVGDLSGLKRKRRQAVRIPLWDWVKRTVPTLKQSPVWQYRWKHLPGTPWQTTLSALFDPQYRGSTGIIGIQAPLNRKSLTETVRTALDRKLPKLVKTQAKKRILLLEKDLRLYRTSKLAEVIDTLEREFPDLRRVDEIWHIDTSASQPARFACQRVRPRAGAFFA